MAIGIGLNVRSSATVCSVSACDGASWPAVRAAANFAVSQAIWTWRTSGNMSGARRLSSSVRSSPPFAPRWLAALSRQPSRLRSIFRISRTRR